MDSSSTPTPADLGRTSVTGRAHPSAARWWFGATFAVALLGSAGTFDVGLASFVVSPMEHHLSVAAGERGSTSVVIHNTGTRRLSLKLYLADSHFAIDGREEDIALGALPRSCAPWVTFGTELLDLPAGEMRQVTIDLAPPLDARGSYWTKLYIEEMSTPEPIVQEHAGRRYQVFMRQRMGIRILEDVPGTCAPDLLVTHVKVGSSTVDDHSVAVAVENTGNALLRCNGWIEVRSSWGEVIETLTPGTDGRFLVFPGAKRELSASSTLRLPADTYTVLALVDYGGETVVAGEEVFEVRRSTGRTSTVATK